MSAPTPAVPADSQVLQDDLRDLLLALELEDHARPQSPHEVFRECIRTVELWRRALNIAEHRLREFEDRAVPADVRGALEEAQTVLRLCVGLPPRDPDHHDEVKELGRRIGFGALMSAATRAWREVLEEDGWPVGGEFVSGPCRATVEKCLKMVGAALASLPASGDGEAEKGGENE